MIRLGGPQYVAPGQEVPGADLAYRPSPRAQAAAQAAGAPGITPEGVLGGAAQGAAIGTSIAPGWGTLIGAGAGAIGGALKGGFAPDSAGAQVGDALEGQGPVGQMATPLLKKRFG